MPRRSEKFHPPLRTPPDTLEEALASGLSKHQWLSRKRRAQKARRRMQNAWVMYDWANSAYSLVITSTIFPTYFESITGDEKPETIDTVTLFGRTFVNTALYNYVLAAAFLIVALLSPVLSARADAKGNKRNFLAGFAVMGSLSCAGLYFYDETNLWLGLLLSALACIGFWGSLVFYNSYLPEIASPSERDRVSARGFGFGYAGSIILQVICLALVLGKDFLEISGGFAAQLSFLLTGLWWLGFSQLPLSRLPKGNTARDGSVITHEKGYAALRIVGRQIAKLPVLKRYLAAFFCYSMGVQTVMLVAALYGKSELQIPTNNLIISILVIQVIAIPGAWIIARLSAKIGNLRALCICVLFWIGICFAGYYMPAGEVNAFYGLSAAVGFVMGGIQSLSRSTYAKMIPGTVTDTTSFFSFYDVTEKIAIVAGMLSFGFIIEQTGSQRASVLTLAGYFAAGLLLLLFALAAAKKHAQNDRSQAPPNS